MGISIKELMPGDVLLFHGKGFVSWAIRKIDGSEANHAALVLPGGLLAEASGLGLRTRPIPTLFDHDDYMLVRRHLVNEPLEPVLETAETYLDNRNFYAYQQIVLLAVLGLTRRIPARGLARRMIRSALDHAARALMDLLPLGASWMICSEYVYRCFDEAVSGSSDPYRVQIAGLDYGARLLNEESWADWAEQRTAQVDVAAPMTFELPGRFDADVAEAELAPLIVEWAAFAGVEDDLDPLPEAGPVPMTFEHATPGAAASVAAEQREEISDQDLQAAMVQFSETLKVARGTAPGVPVSFGLVPATVAGAAVKGALKGLRELTADPNFVTPRDLLVSHSFSPAQRAQ